MFLHFPNKTNKRQIIESYCTLLTVHWVPTGQIIEILLHFPNSVLVHREQIIEMQLHFPNSLPSGQIIEMSLHFPNSLPRGQII